MNDEDVNRRAQVLFVALGAVWGIPYLFIKIAVQELSPEMLVLARSAIAAALLLPFAAVRRELMPALRRWKPLLAFTVAEIVLPWYFLSAAEQRIASSTTGILLAAVPLVAAGVTVALGRRDRLSRSNWLGILIGMLGVVCVVGLTVAGPDVIGIAQLGVVVIGYALGPAILARWMSDLGGLGVIGLALTITTLIYVPVVGWAGSWPRVIPPAPIFGSVLVLAVLCSAVGFVLMFELVAEIGPIRATAISYVNPAVAVVAGAIVIGEPITPWIVLGMVLVLLGSFLVTTPRDSALQRVKTRARAPGHARSGLSDVMQHALMRDTR